MFRKPLIRDPLVVIWAVVMLAAAVVALSRNTTWRGHLDPARVEAFLSDLSAAAFWSLLVLFLAAWLRSRLRAGAGRKPAKQAKQKQAKQAPEGPPWTDRWLRDWREAEARGRTTPHECPLPVLCRHGAAVDGPIPADQPPVLRALSVSHHIVRPGSSVSVTWCFEHAEDVVVDGHGGFPACGEAPVRIDASRRIELVGRNPYGTTSVATASVVAVEVPDLPNLAFPPPVALRTDVAATVGAATPITARLDEFWAGHERPALLGARTGPPPRLVGVPSSVIDRLRRARRAMGEEPR